jgi:anhydro-N-acetylmuramic acid kinase
VKQSTFMRWLVVWLLAAASLLWLSLSIRGAAAKAGNPLATDSRLETVAALKATGPHLSVGDQARVFGHSRWHVTVRLRKRSQARVGMFDRCDSSGANRVDTGERESGANQVIAPGRFRAIGLMSGTSMDGIDAADLETDGESHLTIGAHASTRYPPDLRRMLLRLPSNGVDMPSIEREVTDLHCQAVRSLCASRNIDLATIDVIGFHGQTILHAPEEGRTWQLGDGQRMADALGRPVVNNFRQNDMNHGGQGAPFAPAYHRALVRSCGIPQPIAVLNIGGVSNVTLIDGELLYACDCGPGNALIDDWVSVHCGAPYDEGGKIAAAGRINEHALTTLLSGAYFRQRGPKSLDRNTFSADPVSGLSSQDGAATLAAFTAAAIAGEAQRLPCEPREWVVVGGGRLNRYLLAELRRRLSAPVHIAEELGWSGDAIEAQAFGYLAIRSIVKLPLSWPSTTGVSEPLSGGVLWNPAPRSIPPFKTDF